MPRMARKFLLLVLIPYSMGNVPSMPVHPRLIPTLEMRIVSEAISRGLPPHIPLQIAYRESKMDPKAVHCCNFDGSSDRGMFQLNDSVVHLLKMKDPLDFEENMQVAVKILAGYWKAYRGNRAKLECAYARGPGRCSP